MPIRREAYITRTMVQAEPETLFVFGDNLQRAGFGGQAKEMRGEPNAVGIPTKRAPRMDPDAFLSDDEETRFEFNLAAGLAFERLARHLEAGGTVVLPADSIGTGLADLERRAPRIWASLQRAIARLEAIDPLSQSEEDS